MSSPLARRFQSHVVAANPRQVTKITSRSSTRDRWYEAYASQHSGSGSGEAIALIYRRDIRPALPTPRAGMVVDISCGRGELVRLLRADGYEVEGVDISPEQMALARASGLDRVREGDYRDILRERIGNLAAVTATDVLEHLTKHEVLDIFDHVAAALVPGGVFVARVPNAVSPFGLHIRYGDFTHESWFTARSIRQLAAEAGFCSVTVLPCPPVAHGLISVGRAAPWHPISALCKTGFAAETGDLPGHIVTQNLTFTARKSG